MKKIFSLLAIFAIAVTLSSCDKDEPETSFKTDFAPADTYVYTVNSQSGDVSLADGCSVSLKFDSNGNASVKMDAVNLGGGVMVWIDCPDEKWTIDTKTGARSIVIPQTPALTAGYTVATVTNLTIKCLDRAIDGAYLPALQITMTVDNQYNVRVIQRSMVAFGETSVTTKRTGDVFTTKETYYGILLDRINLTADVIIRNAKFAANMPAQTRLTVPDVPVTLTATGYTLSAASVVPIAPNGSPRPEYEVTDLTATGVYGGRLDLSFTVAGAFDLSARLSEDGIIGNN